MEFSTTLVWVVFAAFLAPIVVDFLPIPKVPVVVVELMLGAILGPHLIDVIRDPHSLHHLQEFGVIFLFFLAGFEVDMNGIKGGPLRQAFSTWLISLAIGMGIAWGLQEAGMISHFYLFGIAFATTAMGPLMPMLADRKMLGTPFGNHVISIGAVGEFGPVLLIAFLLNQTRSSLTTAALILAFALVCVMLLRNLKRVILAGRQSRLLRIALTTFESSAQFAVRFSLLLLIFLVYLAGRFDLDVLLGAFAAGFIIGQMGELSAALGAERYMDHLLDKLESIGFGMFIPVFFVLTGANLDLSAFAASGRAWIALPLVVIGSLIIRGLPTMLVYQDIDRDLRGRLSLMSATQLPLVATLMATYLAREYIDPDIAAAIVLGSVVTVAVFPLVAFQGLRPKDVEEVESNNEAETEPAH